MSADTSAHLARIKQSVSTLNKLADQATEQIKALSASLAAEGGLGLSVEGPSIGEGRELVEHTQHWRKVEYLLMYGRGDDGEFDLCVRAGAPRREDPAGDSHPMWIRPLASVSRQIRLAAVAHLPEFIKTLAQECEKMVAATEQSLGVAKQAIEQLKTVTQQP
jgi:hypothetical protein